MLLHDYLDKLRKNKLHGLNKPWVRSSIINDDFLANIYPDEKAEEWKNFSLKSFSEKNWNILETNKIVLDLLFGADK